MPTMRALLAMLVGASMRSTAFVVPDAGATNGAASTRAAALNNGRRRTPFLPKQCDGDRAALSATSTSDTTAEAKKAPYLFQNYDKPIVLIGSSSSSEANELERLAVGLSGALLGNNPKKLRGVLERLERSQGAGLLGDDDDDDNDIKTVAGISLSAVGMDEEGPFLLDSDLIGGLIRKKTMSLTSGVIVLDFNHAAFQTDDEGLKVDLTRALSSLAKQLYEDEGLLSVYVNVKPDGAAVSEEAEAIEKEVMVPFSDYELCVKNEGAEKDDGPTWEDLKWELNRIVARALLPPPVVGATGGSNTADLVMGLNTFFVSLTFPEVEMAAPYVEQMCQDVDSLEYRVDLLAAAKEYSKGEGDNGDGEKGEDESGGSGDPRFDILYQQQRLRAMCRPFAQRAPGLPFAGTTIIDDALPIVYTVRTANQAGTWPDDKGGIEKMFELLELGLRSAAEVLDVESAWDTKLTDELLTRSQSRYTSLILGSHHVVGKQVPLDEAVDLFLQCGIQGRAHGAKVVLSITSNENDEDTMAYLASLKAAKLQDPEIPNISLLLGEIGSYSRILNPRFTPVTHECLPFKAAPGQLTAAEIMAGKLLDGRLKPQRYGILGHNIAYSVSPQMQSAAFAATKLPHTYTRCDVETVEEFVEGPVWNDDDFGGCSVTIPHKQNIIPHLDVLTDAAKEIGSVNTVIVKTDKFGTRVLIGDNTDWRGMYNPLRRRLGDDVGEGQYVLILGGGGTARAAAYTAKQLGLERIYWNRTPSKAADLAREFGGVVATSLDDDADDEGSLGAILSKNKGSARAIISTLPNAAGFILPEYLLSDASSLPAVLDVNYKPYDTPLLLQSIEAGCDVVRGSEMLWEQGAGQFELWTGRAAPYGVMRGAVLENCLPKEEEE